MRRKIFKKYKIVTNSSFEYEAVMEKIGRPPVIGQENTRNNVKEGKKVVLKSRIRFF